MYDSRDDASCQENPTQDTDWIRENEELRRRLAEAEDKIAGRDERIKERDDTVEALHEQLAAFAKFLRAIRCARFLGIKARLLLFIIELAWIRPRFVYGLSKDPVPVFVHAGKMASVTGCDKVSVYRALKDLEDGKVIRKKPNGYIPNPRWKEWFDPKTKKPYIHPSCYHSIEYSEDSSQVVHQCGDTTGGPDGVTKTQPAGDRPVTKTQNDGEKSPQASAVNGDTSKVASTQLLSDRPVTETQLSASVAPTQLDRTKRNAGASDKSSQSKASESPNSWRSEKVSEEIYLSKPIDQQREATPTDDSMQSTITVGDTGAQSENNDIYIYPDNASQTSIRPEDGQASANPSPIITADPAPTILADTATGSPTTPATASPTPRTVESPIEAHGGHSGAYSSPHGHTRTETAPPAVTIANNHASYQAAMPSRAAVEYTMAGELPGPFTVDPDQWRTFVALTDQYMPMREIASKLHLYRRQFPTAWFVKIAKRCVLTKDKKSITHGYMLSILRAWGRNGDGPDTGPEEEYRDDLTMIAVPFVPFQSTIMGNSAGVELDAYGEPSRFSPEVKAKFMEMMNERMRRYAT